MKNILIAIALSLSVSAFAGTSTVSLAPGAMSNVLNLNNGFAKVTSITVASTTGSNTLVTLYDTPTNILVFTNAAYTGTVSYLTNVINILTNYYGGTNLVTNSILIDGTNTSFAISTNSYQPKVSVSAAAGTAETLVGNYKFGYGIWATNASTGASSITIQYER